jgi:hypothetical protein
MSFVRAVMLFFPTLLAAQTQSSAAASAWTQPRTPDGQPDLQGVWNNGTVTPLERPAEFAGKDRLSEQEQADFEKRVYTQGNRDRRDGSAEADIARDYNDFWIDRAKKGTPDRRTSLIVDPPDGRIPGLLPEAQVRQGALQKERRDHIYDGPEYRSLSERCIMWPNEGPPMLPEGYNSNLQIVQSSGSVAILQEMIHDVRIIPTDGSPHLPSDIRQWLGDSRGHWEGDTLVIDTTNFTDRSNFRGSSEKLHVVERITRVAADEILYEFTAGDPSTWAKPWTAVIPMRRADAPIYEYACHEGNYGMPNILSVARAAEKKAAEKKAAETPKR